MPLRAEISGTSVLAWELGGDDWKELQRLLRANRALGRLSCCGGHPVPKTSKLGTQFFAHLPRSECFAARETEEHLRAKQAAYQGCLDAGWDARIEASGDGGAWRADVLAMRGQTRIAFEIQWTAQSLERTRERQDAYARDGISCYWVFRVPPHAGVSNELPIFQLTDPAQSVAIADRKFTVREFTRLVLEDRVRFCRYAVGWMEPRYHRVRQAECPRCHTLTRAVEEFTPEALSVCGRRLVASNATTLYAETLPEELRVFDAHSTVLRRHPKGKTFVEGALGNGLCPACEQVIPLSRDRERYPIESEVPEARQMTVHSAHIPHWCLGSDGKYCSDLLTSARGQQR